ncbi:unnamed protein product [Acanthosepion pharaonis]|uniref:Uncharacterized protein n=1 Tax=Acanthosepion pharaonis TaxID=158019 RepID=A0A812ATE5_ACAPH|nr:unnamed protein product [Sepia pharaonis]
MVVYVLALVAAPFDDFSHFHFLLLVFGVFPLFFFTYKRLLLTTFLTFIFFYWSLGSFLSFFFTYKRLLLTTFLTFIFLLLVLNFPSCLSSFLFSYKSLFLRIFLPFIFLSSVSDFENFSHFLFLFFWPCISLEFFPSLTLFVIGYLFENFSHFLFLFTRYVSLFENVSHFLFLFISCEFALLLFSYKCFFLSIFSLSYSVRLTLISFEIFPLFLFSYLSSALDSPLTSFLSFSFHISVFFEIVPLFFLSSDLGDCVTNHLKLSSFTFFRLDATAFIISILFTYANRYLVVASIADRPFSLKRDFFRMTNDNELIAFIVVCPFHSKMDSLSHIQILLSHTQIYS